MEKPKKKKSVGDIILTIVLILAIAVFCFAAYNLFHIFMEYKKGTDEYNHIAEMAVTEKEPDLVEIQQTEKEKKEEIITAPMKIDFNSLKSVNDDVIGWIYMEALDGVSYPVVQGTDNSTYLHTTYEKNYNFAGTIFVDCENSRDFNDCNTLIYGHNMKNGSMFAQLKNYCKDPEIYKKSKYFWIFTPEKDYRYEIIAAYTTPLNSDTYTLFKGPGEEFERYLDKIISYSEIQTNADNMTIKDKIVTLSTCTGNNSTRFVVQGRRINTLNAVSE